MGIESLIEKLEALKKPINNDRFDYRLEREHNSIIDAAIFAINGCLDDTNVADIPHGNSDGATFQQRVEPWMLECFGPEIAADTDERNHRFIEEALELVQSCGATASECHQLVDYVFNRPVGEPHQESGGVMVTHAALCLANGLDMHENGEVELDRIWGKVETIRAKQAAKPKHSPLPVKTGGESGWQPLATAPKGFDGEKFNHILFRGVSKARSFSGEVYVSGWMDNERKPVHEYSYKLNITGWKPLSALDDAITP